MKLKCKKIYGTEKNICTAEQKIAYNYAFSYHDLYKDLKNDFIPGFVRSELLHKAINFICSDIKTKELDKKYNIDAIVIAFRNGFETYCKKPFIATNYEEIGKFFNIPYEIE